MQEVFCSSIMYCQVHVGNQKKTQSKCHLFLKINRSCNSLKLPIVSGQQTGRREPLATLITQWIAYTVAGILNCVVQEGHLRSKTRLCWYSQCFAIMQNSTSSNGILQRHQLNCSRLPSMRPSGFLGLPGIVYSNVIILSLLTRRSRQYESSKQKREIDDYVHINHH